MHYSVVYVAPLVAAAYAQSAISPVVVPVISGSVTVSSTYTYSNFETQFLTQTNSLGVVTGQPTLSGNTAIVTTQPAVVTSQPDVATIPAGLPTGINTVWVANSSFLVSVASSTTLVVGGDAPTDASVVTGPTAGVNTDSGAAATGSDSGAAVTSSGSGSSTTSSSAAAPTAFKLASGAILGLGAMAAALL